MTKKGAEMSEYQTVSFRKEDIESFKAAMAISHDLEGTSYSSLAEFIRDAMRRRMEPLIRKSKTFLPITDRKLAGMDDG